MAMAYGLWSTVYGLWSMIYDLWSMVYGLWFMVCASPEQKAESGRITRDAGSPVAGPVRDSGRFGYATRMRYAPQRDT